MNMLGLLKQKGKDNKYRDYYVWRDGVAGAVPNGLRSTFSGSAWEFDAESGQYFCICLVNVSLI